MFFLFVSQETLAGLIGCLAFLSHGPSHEARGGICINGVVSFFHLLAVMAHFPVSRAPWIAPIVILSSKYLHLMEPIPEVAWRVCALALSLASFFLLSQCRVNFFFLLFFRFFLVLSDFWKTFGYRLCYALIFGVSLKKWLHHWLAMAFIEYAPLFIRQQYDLVCISVWLSRYSKWSE